MNHHEAPLRSGRARRALHCLALLLLSELATESTLAGSRTRISVRTIGDWRPPHREPYLPVIGTPGLRFQEVEPPPEQAARPVAVGPPVPGLNVAEAAVAAANTAARRVPTAGDAKPKPTGVPKRTPPPAVPAKPVPPAILPDDMRPQVRAEDFLPFFQVPGSVQTGASTSVPVPPSAPGPAPLPPSSATYLQTPR